MNNIPLRLTAALFSLTLMAPLASARVLPEKDMQVFMQSRRTLRSNARQSALLQTRRRLAAAIPLQNHFYSPEAGTSIRYPSTWQAQNLIQHEGNLTLIVMFLSPGELGHIRENANLVLEDLTDQNTTLDEYTRLGLEKEAEIFENFTLLSNERTVIAGQTAQQVSFRATANGLDMTFRQVWFFRRGQVHVWTFADETSRFASHIGTFEAMLESLVVD